MKIHIDPDMYKKMAGIPQEVDLASSTERYLDGKATVKVDKNGLSATVGIEQATTLMSALLGCINKMDSEDVDRIADVIGSAVSEIIDKNNIAIHSDAVNNLLSKVVLS